MRNDIDVINNVIISANRKSRRKFAHIHNNGLIPKGILKPINTMVNNDIEDLEMQIQTLKNKQRILRKKNGFPYIDIFELSTNAGEEIEQMICKEIFTDLRRVTNEKFDQKTLSEEKIESKLIRMMVKGVGEYYNRAISILDDERGFIIKKNKYGGNISTSTFQQVKPKEFHHMVGVILFKDGFDIFILPSEKISDKIKLRKEGKVYLSGQHSGNNEEGQINYNDKVLNNHYMFSIYNDGNDLYFFDRKTKTIKEKYLSENIQKYIK